MEEPGPCMAQIVNGQDLALSLLWSCSPKSKAKTRPGHAAKARQLAMLLQRRKHVKQGVPRQCWCESLPAQCAIGPMVQKSMCFGEHAVRVPERSRSEHLDPWLDSHIQNTGVIRRTSGP